MMAIDSGGSTSVYDRVLGLGTNTKISRAEANGGYIDSLPRGKMKLRFKCIEWHFLTLRNSDRNSVQRSEQVTPPDPGHGAGDVRACRNIQSRPSNISRTTTTRTIPSPPD